MLELQNDAHGKTPGIEQFYPEDRSAWRKWLLENHDKKQAVWLVFCKKSSGLPTISWSDAVDEALCFGWIDSRKKTLDENRYIQYFCPRKPGSCWSRINKQKIAHRTDSGLMMPAGHEAVGIAQRDGSWTLMDEVEDLIIPEDLEAAFNAKPGARAYFVSLSRSDRRGMLAWLVFAKRAVTREKRITEITTYAAKRQKPPRFT